MAHQFPYISGVIRCEYIAKAFRSPWKMEQINRLEVAKDLQEDVHWHFCDKSKMAPLSFHPTLLHFFHNVPVILLNNLDAICGLLPLSRSLLRLCGLCWSWSNFGGETRRFAGGHSRGPENQGCECRGAQLLIWTMAFVSLFVQVCPSLIGY